MALLFKESIWVRQERKSIVSMTLGRQFFRIWPIFAICISVGILAVIGIQTASLVAGRPGMILTRDPVSLMGASPFIGLLSNIGILFWSSTTAICFIGALILRNSNRNPAMSLFLLLSGIFSLVLTLDDLFLLHENVFPTYFHIYQPVTYTAYVVLTLVYLLVFYHLILRTEYLLLLAALLFLGMSLILDSLFGYGNVRVLIEDSLKFVGILFWLAYFSRTVVLRVRGGDIGKTTGVM
jgi:hypothetical protein